MFFSTVNNSLRNGRWGSPRRLQAAGGVAGGPVCPRPHSRGRPFSLRLPLASAPSENTCSPSLPQLCSYFSRMFSGLLLLACSRSSTERPPQSEWELEADVPGPRPRRPGPGAPVPAQGPVPSQAWHTPWSSPIPTCFMHQATRGILVGNPLWDHPNPCPAPCFPLGANEKGRGPLNGSWPQRV